MHKVTEGDYKCTKCGKTKPDSEFYKDSRKKSGISSWCKTCTIDSARAAAKRRQKIRDAILAKMQKVQEKKTAH